MKGIGKALMWIMIALLGAGVVAGGVTWLLISKITKPATPAAAPPLAKQTFTVIDVDKFLVKLKDQDKNRYLDLSVRLVISDAKAEEDVKKDMPFIRDAIGSYLAGLNSTQLTGQEGYDLIRTQLLDRVRKVMGEETVKQVLINSMVVQ